MEGRQQLFALLAQPSLKAIGFTPPAVAARLFVALASEAAVIEMEAGGRVRGAREMVRAFVGARD